MRAMLLGTVGLAMLLTGCGDDTAGPTAATSSAVALSVGRVAEGIEASSCQSRSNRYPWGRAELRTWTPRLMRLPDGEAYPYGRAIGAPFTARLVHAYGEDYGAARRTVIVEQADGCRRQYSAESFSDADRSLIDAEVARRPTAPDPTSYRVHYNPWLTSPELVESGALRLHATQHFSIWYGVDRNGSFYRELEQWHPGRTPEQVIRETGEWLEKQWFINRDAIGTPMPFADGNDPRKLNIYVCGTGRPNAGGDIEGCGASAAEEMGISLWAMNKGSSVLTHEFGHMVQFYTGGFRDRPEGGPIWEVGAQWNALVVSPLDYQSWPYINQLERGPLFADSRYSSHLFMQYLFEKDDTRDLVFDAWTNNLRNERGASQEDYTQAFVRLAQERGIYPHGFASFGDDMGRYAMRVVARDFQIQAALNRFDYHRLNRVATVRDRRVFASPAAQPLLQWGMHLVELTPNADTITVTLTGGTVANQASWRLGLVALAADGTPTYSALARADGMGSGTASLAVPQGTTSVVLAVTAAPNVYESLGWNTDGTHFPYRVRVDGAVPNR